MSYAYIGLIIGYHQPSRTFDCFQQCMSIKQIVRHPLCAKPDHLVGFLLIYDGINQRAPDCVNLWQINFNLEQAAGLFGPCHLGVCVPSLKNKVGFY